MTFIVMAQLSVHAFHLADESDDPTLTIIDDSIEEVQDEQGDDEIIELTASPTTIEMIDLSTPSTIDLCTPDEPNEETLMDSSIMHLSPK